MTQLEYSDITEIVTSLDLDFQTLRTDAHRRYELYAMRRDPYVPEEIAREGKLRMLSPLLIDAAKAIRSDIMMNPTEFTVFPLARERDGSISRKTEVQAENLERAQAIIWGRLNEGRRIDREIVWHQLVSPFGVMILEFNELALPDQPEWMKDEAYVNYTEQIEHDWMPWSIYVPDPLTCSWIERDGRPILFARRYKVLARDAEELYSKKRGSVNPEANLRLTKDGFNWVSDDYERDSNAYKAGFQEVEMLWLDDGKYVYHVTQNPGSGTGQVVWAAPNPTDQVTAFVVPGNTTPSRKPEDRYEPFLLPLMQSVLQINDLRSMRATTARNIAGPNTYIAVDPEVAKLKIQRGEKFEEIRWKKNVTHQILGKVESFPSELSPDWDRVENAVTEEMQRFLPSPFVHIIDPAVLKAATATSILHAAEAGLRLYGPLMAVYDAAIRDVMEVVEQSVRMMYPDLDMPVFATGEERTRNHRVAEGSVYRFSLDAIDFPHRLLVRTRGMSQAQAAAQYELALSQWVLPDGSKGPATYDDLLDAANVTDRVAQKMKLAKEAALSSVDPWLRQMAMESAAARIFLESGEQLPLGPEGAAEQQPSGMPNQAQRMASPLIPPPSGGSASGLEGA